MDNLPDYGTEQRFSVSLIKQGNHRFCTFSIYSDILAKCCYVSTKQEDVAQGFQRLLDEKRAKDIATYIDAGLGTIPNSIVLSAQPEAKFKVIGAGKTASFVFDPHSFLVIDGQHRVYGFSLAKTRMRVPVVVYDSLTRAEEARLFIDVNTKQKPVPKELLLAIKSLALTDTDEEALLGEIFDRFDQDIGSALFGLTSPISASKSKISRVTFNAGIKPLLPSFREKSSGEIYKITNAYLSAVVAGLKGRKLEKSISNKTVFRAFLAMFQDCASRVQDRHGRRYTAESFFDVLRPVFDLKTTFFTKPSNSHAAMAEEMMRTIRLAFSI